MEKVATISCGAHGGVAWAIPRKGERFIFPFHLNGCQTTKKKLLITPGESGRLEVGERDNLRGSLGQLVKFWLDVIDSSLRIASFCHFYVLGVY